ncbi:glycogenin-1-like isoform X2 [Panonychus citri]|uniref:glycogenin-1-like isoform X2 n=1 Tax=Panonychus citri TaxID=50023 RepID=UPI0023083092|nr:glycogenin-1-like isoform X2 [Panonychus citri]
MEQITGDEAFVTLSTNDNYCLGALVLAHSLRNVGTTRKLVILVTPSVSSDMRKCLSKAYDLVQEVDVMHSNEHKILEVMKRPELGVTLTKLHCWRLTQFKKCIFMDADTLTLKNIDELFQKEELSAVCDIGWPDCFNTGLFVFRPSEQTFANLCALASESGSFDGGDQGLLNTYFSDWSTSDISRHLSFIYNMSSVSTYSYPAAYQRFGDTVKVVHFLGALKPWMYGFNAMTRKVIPPAIGSQTQQLEHVQKWWDVFINQVQPYLSSDCSGLASQLAKLRLDSPTDSHYPGIIGNSAHLDDYSRKRAWEAGSVDYLGVDSFENIQKKLDQAIGENPYFLPSEESFEGTSDDQPASSSQQQQQQLQPTEEIPSSSATEQQSTE